MTMTVNGFSPTLDGYLAFPATANEIIIFNLVRKYNSFTNDNLMYEHKENY